MKDTRRQFIASGAVASVAGDALPQSTSARPNIVFFMPETMRAESLQCYGHPVVKTPNFDRLAGEGVRFANCCVQNPVCGPSRVSWATGWPVHVRGHRSLYYFLRPDEPNIFRYLKRGGYDVYWFGKNDLLAPESFADSVTEWGNRPPRGRAGRNPYAFEDPHYYSFLHREGGDRTETADFANIQSAIRVMERAERPFCLYLPLSYVHPPFTAPKDFYGMYSPDKLPPLRPPNLSRKPNYHEAIRRAMRLDKLNDADFRKIQAVYLGMISYSDWLLGELMAALERTNHAKNTALFTFSDHGEWGGDYGLVEKWPNAMDDVLTHIPLIVRAPGVKAGHVAEEMVELFDVMPTSLELAGVKAEHTHFAHSLMPQLHGQPGDSRRAAFCEGGYNVNEPQCFEPLADYDDPRVAYYPKVALQNQHPETVTRTTMIRTRNSKLVLRPDGESEFYDLREDPRELHNVFGERTYATRQSDLERRMLNWYVRTSDVAPWKRDPRGFPQR